MPQPRKHLTQVWFHLDTTKDQATSALIHMADGSFLVRISEQDPNTNTLSLSYVPILEYIPIYHLALCIY